MRLNNLSAALMAFMAIPVSAEAPQFKDQADKFSYALGMDIAPSIVEMQESLGLNKDLILRGIQDSLNGKTAFTKEEANQLKSSFESELRSRMLANAQKIASENSKAGKEFLEKNKTKAGVKTTASGLQYEVITEGTGEQPKATDTVTVHYRGTLLNGEEFDSSYSRNEPTSFPLNGVIRGWTEGLQLMKTGSKYKFYIPSELAYGERGAGQKIGPNSTLIFEVELIKIEK